MKPWSRDDTREWIQHILNRVEDIHYYLERTDEWCDHNQIHDHETRFTCNFLTVLWVSRMREETISYKELLEILGLSHLEISEDKIYDLGNEFRDVDHEELLRLVTKQI